MVSRVTVILGSLLWISPVIRSTSKSGTVRFLHVVISCLICDGQNALVGRVIGQGAFKNDSISVLGWRKAPAVEYLVTDPTV